MNNFASRIQSAINEKSALWITTKKRGRIKVSPVKIMPKELLCDVIFVSHIGDGAGTGQSIPLVEILSVEQA